MLNNVVMDVVVGIERLIEIIMKVYAHTSSTNEHTNYNYNYCCCFCSSEDLFVERVKK
jgi:hypothetical protein